MRERNINCKKTLKKPQFSLCLLWDRFAFKYKKTRSTNESSKRSDVKTFDCNFNFVLFR